MFKRTRFGHRRHSFRCYENHFFAETACGVITSPSMFGHAPLKVICSTDVVSSCAAQNVNPSHRKAGSAGTRTRNQRLKRALLYRLSYRPTWNVSLYRLQDFSMQNPDYSFREFKFAAYARIRISLDGHAAISETQRDASSCGDRFPDDFNHGIPSFFHRHGRHADECINKVSAHIL